MTNDASSSQGAHTEFAKELGLKESVAIAVGAMIGGGIFTALGRLALISGPSAILSFILGGLIAFLTANSYYRLVNKYPSAGGEFVILRRGYENPLIGNSIGAMLWLGYSVTIALYAFTFGNYVSEFIFELTHLEFFKVVLEEGDPVPSIFGLITFPGRKILSFLSIFIFMIINLRGVKETGTVQNVIVLFKVFVLLMVGVIGVGVFLGDPVTIWQDRFNGDLSGAFFRTNDSFVQSLGGLSGFGGMIIGSAVIFVSYEGFQVIANTVEEMKNPGRDVKIGMYISVLTVTFTYAITTFATFVLIDQDANISETALLSAMESFGVFFVLMVALGAAASTTSAINATLLGSSRLAYVMSDWAAFPKRLAVVSKKTQVPYLAIIITSFISWLFTFVGEAPQIAEAGSIIFLGIFLAINLTMIKIFPKESNWVAKVATILIVIYITLVFVFFATHPEESGLALGILIFFSIVTVVWMVLNEKRNKGVEIDTSYYELEPLGKEQINPFTQVAGPQVDDFFIGLDNILVPMSGAAFETQNIYVSGLLAHQYNAKITFVTIGDKSVNDDIFSAFEGLKVDYTVVHKPNGDIAQGIIDTYREGDYQLVSMASKRRESLSDRLFDKSVSKKVVDAIDSAVLQVHPPAYGQRSEQLKDLFLLFDGSERDVYLARWAKLLSSQYSEAKINVYHIILLPQTIPFEDAANLQELKQSAENFKQYANDVCNQVGLTVNPILLYGHNFVKAITEQVKKHQPDCVLIGHTKDEGLWNRIRTHLSYKIMNKIPSSVIVKHMGKK